jgi:hypothetical protein
VGEHAHARLGGDSQAVAGVDPRRGQQLLAEGVAELLDVAVERHPRDLEQDVPGQRVAVGV